MVMWDGRVWLLCKPIPNQLTCEALLLQTGTLLHEECHCLVQPQARHDVRLARAHVVAEVEDGLPCALLVAMLSNVMHAHRATPPRVARGARDLSVISAA
jgi:hypothetical protein